MIEEGALVWRSSDFLKKAVLLSILAGLICCAYGGPLHAATTDKTTKVPSCLIATFEQLRAQWQFVPHRSLLTTTSKIGAGSEIQVVLSGPVPFPKDYTGTKSLADLDFRSFVVNSGKSSANAKPPKPRRNGEPPTEGKVRLVQESLPPEIANKLNAEQQKNYLLQINVPVHASRHILWQDRHLVVVGCAAGLDPPPPFTTFATAKVSVPNAARRYLETANEVNVLLKALSHRLVDDTILLNPELP